MRETVAQRANDRRPIQRMKEPKPKLDAVQLRSSPPNHMSLGEAATYLGISDRKLWSEMQERKVRAARIGTRIIFKRADLDRYVDTLLAAA